MSTNRRTLFGLLTILVNTVIIYCIFRPYIWNPNDYFFSTIQDGIKNYFTPLYYIKYGHGAWFSGMNYPFGDNIVFSDNQPILSVLLKWLNDLGVPVLPHVVGIMNIIMLSSIVATAYFLFLILSFYMVRGFYSMLFATGIAMLSPQVERITGHYGLSYTFYIPMIWYFLLMVWQSKAIFNGYLIALVLTGVLFSFLHIYYCLMFQVFIALYAVVTLIMSREGKWRRSLLLLFISTFPPIAIKIYSLVTDPITDRIKIPYGFTVYAASWKSVFLPLQDNFFSLNSSFEWFRYDWNPEAISYVGLTGLIFFIAIIFIFIINVFRRRFRKMFKWHLPITLSYSIIAAVLVLLFSMCYPFKLHMMWITDKISFIKQFRSLGRFAWIFFYIYSVTIAYLSYLLIRKLRIDKYKTISMVLALLIFLGWSLDGLAHLMHKREAIDRGDGAISYTRDNYYLNLLAKCGKKADDFQAIIALPFFDIGSEKFYLLNMQSAYQSMRASYRLGLPLIDNAMSRTSISQTSLIVQWVADSLIYRSIIDSLPSSKPILLITTGNSFSSGEDYLMSKSTPLVKKDDISLFELNPDDFKTKMADEIAKKGLNDNAFKYHQQGDILSSDSSIVNTLYTNYSFDKPDISYWKAFSQTGQLNLFTLNTSASDSGRKYEYSAWIYIDDVESGMPEIHCKEYDRNNNIVAQSTIISSQRGNTYKQWLRVSDYYWIDKSCKRVEITCEGDYMLVCNFVNRRPENNFIQLDKGIVKFYNNYPVYETIKVN